MFNISAAGAEKVHMHFLLPSDLTVEMATHTTVQPLGHHVVSDKKQSDSVSPVSHLLNEKGLAPKCE